MPNVSIPLINFTGGEWSPRLHGRIDVEKYGNALSVLKNMIVYPHGGVTRRMGTEYIGDAKTTDARLIPFEYNREQAYVLEFSATTIRFFRNGAQVESGGVPLDLATPYSMDEVRELSFTQSADVLYLVHPNHAPRKLERTGPDTFVLTSISFTNTPSEWGANNYPSTVTFYQERLIFGGCPNNPQTIWMSKTFSYEDMTLGSLAENAIKITISSDQVNAIQWLLPTKVLLVGTTGGEWIISAGGNSSASLTPSNVQALRQSNHGTKNSRVQLIGNSAIYISRDGKKLRSMDYTFESDGFESPELSILSEHLLRQGIVEFDYQQNPDGVLWTVLSDGKMAGMTYLKSQQVNAWHRHETQGEVLSVCTIEGDEHTELWLAVKRNGNVLIERMAKTFEGEDLNDTSCIYLDSALTGEFDPAVSTINGLDHLEGLEVCILADGQILPKQTVTGGEVTLDSEVSKVVIGLPFTSEIETMRPEGGSPKGIAQGKRKRTYKAIVRFERSLGFKYSVRNSNNVYEYPDRFFGEDFNEAPKLLSQDIPISLPNQADRDGRISIINENPLPMTVLMIINEVSVNE